MFSWRSKKAIYLLSILYRTLIAIQCSNSLFTTERVYDKKKTERETEDAATRKSEITLLKSEVNHHLVLCI